MIPTFPVKAGGDAKTGVGQRSRVSAVIRIRVVSKAGKRTVTGANMEARAEAKTGIAARNGNGAGLGERVDGEGYSSITS